MNPRFVALLIVAGTVATRVPFATAHLYAWDSTLYARALEHGFHVTADATMQSPHPPGYIWYVAVAAAVRLLARDSNAALVIVSVAASALAGASFYLIARRLVRESVAIVATGAFVLSPVMWLYSEVAYPYTVLALLSLVLGWWLVDGRRPIAASLALGILTGFRQDLLLVLGPLWLWRVAPLGGRRAALSLAALAGGALSWAVPTIALSGGLAEYVRALMDQSGMITSGALGATGAALPVNAVLLAEALFWGALPFALVLVADGGWHLVRLVRGASPTRPRGIALAFVLWTGPAVAFYLLVHIGEWGYVLAVLPPLTLAAAMRADRAVARIPSRVWPALGLIAVLVPALVFVFGGIRFSAARLRDRDAELSSRSLVVAPEARAAGEPSAPPTM